MEHKERISQSSGQRGSIQPLVILNQLLQISTQMNHIDEMLSWMTSIFVQNFGVQVAQFWATQASSTGQISVVLRANSCEDISLPQNIIYNAHIAEIAGNMLSRRQGMPLQPVHTCFSTHQSTLFRRYGIYYSFGYFLGSDFLQPPSPNSQPGTEISTPFMASSILLMRQAPIREFVVTISHIMEQIVPIAKRRGLLLDPAVRQASLTPVTPPYAQQPLPPLTEIIPRWSQEAQDLRSQNPFMSAPPIPDKRALRFYQAIDGQKKLFEVAAQARLNNKEALEALQLLLKSRLIQLYDSRGQPINSSLFFNTP
ncbi:hypothetical protein EPA93_39990 [Ktedonosporobacter rubrisoli]|uniref:Uncharacterized protein n=1 Tax=Ktedonosporobacter rubrisoli TaxID=2509675 RepID=A0A4P6K0W2_KTERU|nr:hypothetical protein [Ktedonosporobacter rubrisoli]QBD81828.1 hypothetical protein EPA93_39990 [Ktedonosporobacter rubrisoli]